MSALDYAIFVCYLFAVLVIGYCLRPRSASGADFMVAGRSMKWLPIGISVMATLFSAVNCSAFAGEVFANGLYVLMVLPAFAIVAWPMVRAWIPFYCRSGYASAYEFLEVRFDRSVRRTASGIFMVWRVCWMAIILYVTACLLSPIVELPLAAVVLVCGCLAMAYTIIGGMRAVMWTDVLQFLVLVGGLALGIVMTVRDVGLSETVLHIAGGSRLAPFVPIDPSAFSFDPRIRMTLWSCVIGSSVAFLARYGADHMVVQRYLSARSTRDAQMGFVLNIACVVLSLAGLAVLGLVLGAKYDAEGLSTAGIRPLMAIVGLLRRLPSGARGLLSAGLLASTMSSMDSGIHSCATAWQADFSRRDASDVHALRTVRAATLVAGTLAMSLTVVVGRLGTVFEMANRVINGLGSPLLALFAVAWIGKPFHSRGVLWGGITGTLLSAVTSFCVKSLALHYYALANFLMTFALCLLFSLLLRRGETATR